jgi:hypothetical protein
MPGGKLWSIRVLVPVAEPEFSLVARVGLKGLGSTPPESLWSRRQLSRARQIQS